MAKAKKTSTPSETQALLSLREMDVATLNAELLSARKSHYVLVMRNSLGELKQPHLLKRSRKYIAQISTVLTTAL